LGGVVERFKQAKARLNPVMTAFPSRSIVEYPSGRNPKFEREDGKDKKIRALRAAY